MSELFSYDDLGASRPFCVHAPSGGADACPECEPGEPVYVTRIWNFMTTDELCKDIEQAIDEPHCPLNIIAPDDRPLGYRGTFWYIADLKALVQERNAYKRIVEDARRALLEPNT